MTWRGIVGKSFPTVEAFDGYVSSVTMGLWRPQFVVVHNTSAPDLATYNGWQTRANPVTDEQWALNLQGYYRDTMHWSAGPHLFVTPKSIIAFTPLNVPGTHSPSWNAISWGVETVGEFDRELFTGTVRDNLVGALAVLHSHAGLDPVLMRFHKEDRLTTHKNCPGRNMVKADLIAAVQGYVAKLHSGEHSTAQPNA